MCNAIESVAGPQLFAVCFSYGGDGMENCAGNGASVAVAVDAISATRVGVWIIVGVAGCGVTGNAVGTGPGGLMVFLA